LGEFSDLLAAQQPLNPVLQHFGEVRFQVSSLRLNRHESHDVRVRDVHRRQQRPEKDVEEPVRAVLLNPHHLLVELVEERSYKRAVCVEQRLRVVDSVDLRGLNVD